jgi:hypothetical protein
VAFEDVLKRIDVTAGEKLQSSAPDVFEPLKKSALQRTYGTLVRRHLPPSGGMLSGMAGRKTSVSFDDETLDILARRAEEEGMDRSAYLARLVRRDDLRRRIAADSATLNAAGYTPDRATAVTAALIARRRAVG